MFPDRMTDGEKYGPAMEVQNQEDAQEYLNKCVEHSMRVYNLSLEDATRIEKANIGYFAGYCSPEIRLRVEELFNCIHPILGSAKKQLTPDEVLAIGIKNGQLAAEGKEVPLLEQPA